MKKLITIIALLSLTLLFANVAPVVSNMSAAQRSDGSYLVDVYYSALDADSALLTISLMVSSDGGTTWNISCDLLSGDIGANISPGTNKHIIWNLGMEHPNIVANYHFKITADDGYVPVPIGFAYVPGGTFTMGRTAGTGDSGELPTHNVTLSSFYLGKYEVSQAEYSQYMQPGYNWTSSYGLGNNYPAYYVSWYAILKYCNLRSMAEGLTPVYTISGTTNPASWGTVPTSSNATWNAAICNWAANGYRLPTEAEWEYASRGATNTPDYLYSGSNDINTVAWYYDNNTPYGTKPVGTKSANGLGLYDMSGNVWERCWDWYSSSYYSSSPGTNPKGPASGSYRVKRGGYWYDSASSCRVASRSYDSPYYSGNYLGFRLCRAGL
ncbi:MAG: SUMF1/EgtB/PvdO family nonheme iron enzyme [Candidatus Cloacimonetes bacterium]|nr:SUMF1/EgtB/PvdO family nonheme iron enzyme [Candidatus Cloacimonadota bacterium]